MTLSMGNKVFLKISQSYLITNDPMPMLRPPDLISSNEIGEIVAFMPKDMVAVKFRRGTFVLNLSHIEPGISSKS